MEDSIFSQFLECLVTLDGIVYATNVVKDDLTGK